MQKVIRFYETAILFPRSESLMTVFYFTMNGAK